jgi:hypothetical protein
MQHIDHYGNWTAYCPYKPGVYGMWQVPLDENFLPMKNMIPKGKYEATNDFYDENRPKIEMMMKFSMVIDNF